MRYRVDTIPWFLKPAYLAIAWPLGLSAFAYFWLCRITSRVVLDGPGKRDLAQHAVFGMWHESLGPHFSAFMRYPSRHAAINHPAAYMKPLHIVLKGMGLRHLVLGSSGEEGRRAATELARLVREGHSTIIAVDGPAGPPRVPKKGIFHVSLQSGVPIVPIAVRAWPFIPLPSWDSKKIPVPFGRLTVTFQEPIVVEREDLERAERKLIQALGRGGQG